ncbi:erv26 superfamily protein [Cytospora paraplurivora]|uniref:Erv26 superfamily protein n=1 Tax=Cytospora paraplurivora TaxID=2898453 RepID=A0AAN9YBH1_9PEZI
MWILPLVGILGSIVGFCFLTLAIASGLYYLSELVEEHTVISKRLLSRLIYAIIVLDLLLCFVDKFPFWLTVFGIVSHIVYLGNMRRFPYVTLTDPLFISSCVLVLINHLVWYRHFSARQKAAYNNMTSYYDAPDDIPTFTEIASYFGICVWLVPFALFVSLSASDNILPYENPAAATAADGDGSKRKAQGLAKALVDGVRNTISQVGVTAGWKKRDDGF